MNLIINCLLSSFFIKWILGIGIGILAWYLFSTWNAKIIKKELKNLIEEMREETEQKENTNDE